MFDRLVRLSVGNPVFVNLLFILVMLAGLRAAFSLPREEFPEVSLDSILVSVTYPGATAATIEELVIRPIENEIEGVNNVNKYTANINEGRGSIMVTLNAGVDLQVARAEVEKAVASVDGLPAEADTPVIQEMILTLPVIALALQGEIPDTKVVDRLEDELRDLSGISTVTTDGAPENKIYIDLDEHKLRTLGIRSAQISEAIRSAEANLPAGNIKHSSQDIFVKTEQRIQSASDIARIPIAPGSPLRIGDLAEITEVTEEADTRYWINAKPSVRLTVGREGTADPIEIRDAILEELPRLSRQLPEGVELTISEDYTATIRSRLDMVMSNAIGGALLVLLVLLVMSGLRQALLAVIGMPVSYFSATFLMDQSGMSINLISTFGLLIATGIIVDDAVVVIENVQRHLEMGKSRVRATIDGCNEVLGPVTVAVFTTVLAFLPLTMIGGPMGRIMKILPLVVIFCLMGSLLEAIFLLPGHTAEHASQEASDSHTVRLARWMQSVYRPIVRVCLRNRYWTMLGATLSFFGVLALATTMSFQLGARGQPFYMDVHYEVAPGYSKEITHAQGEAIDRFVRESLGEEHITSSTLRVGSIFDRATRLLTTGSSQGQLHWEFIMSDELVAEYPAMVRELRYYLLTDPELSMSAVKEVAGGPPTGAAVTANLQSWNTEQLNQALEDLKGFLYDLPGAFDIRDNYGIGKETFRVEIDQDRAALYGLTERDIAISVRTAVEGMVVSKVSIDEEPVELVLRYAGGRDNDRNGIRNLIVVGQNGLAIRLDQVADIRRVREVGIIRREGGVRQSTVFADSDRDILPPIKASSVVQEHWDEVLAARYPDTTLSFGGDADAFNESLNDLPGAFGMAMVLIYLVLALQFQSYVQPLIILSAVPFGLMGAIFGLFIMNFDLSLTAMFGIVALVGIVVNDSLVMVDFINKKRRVDGLSLIDAAEAGSVERLRPIVSTTLTTCLGLAPLALGIGGQDDILAPMAISISAGLGIATGLVLIVVPPLYLIVEQIRDLGGRGHGQPQREPDAVVRVNRSRTQQVRTQLSPMSPNPPTPPHGNAYPPPPPLTKKWKR